MKKARRLATFSIFLSAAILPAILFGSTYALWAVTDNAEEININITTYAPGKKRVNYYLPKADGSGFELSSSEQVTDGSTLSNVPTPGSITNYTFEKWSTSDALSDSFDTTSEISQNYDLYAAYYGYEAKGSSDANYTLLSKTTGSVNKYSINNTNNYTSFSYTYALLGTESKKSGVNFASNEFTGNSISVYKHYFATSVHTSIETKTNNTTDGLYKVYFNPSASTNNKLHFTRTVLVQVENNDNTPYIHMWDVNNSSSVTTSWPGILTSNIGYREGSSNKKVYIFDVDTNKANRIIVHDNYGNQTADITIPNNTNNIFWVNNFNYGTDHWFSITPSENLS